jgi:hypothetical protein
MHKRQITYFIFFLLSALALRADDDISVTASFDPAVISEGGRSIYVIRLKNTTKTLENAPVQLPEGLKWDGSASTSRQTNIINGNYEIATTVEVPVKASKLGEYTVPEWIATIAGKDYNVAPTTLKVVAAGEELQGSVLLRLNGAEEPFYIGETKQVSVNLYIRNDTEVKGNGALTLSGDGFILEGMTEKPEQHSERYNNQLYRVLTWNMTVTAISSGQQNLGWSLDLLVALPNQRPRPRLTMNSFFTDFIDESPDWKEVTVKTDDFKTEVKELPTENQPESFTGAIGKFKVEDKVSRTSVKEGDPISVTLTVSGKGNFSRIMPPEVDLGPGWKSYPPKSNFVAESSDPLNLSGKKTFEYIFIPIDESITEIPSIPFSYFDPITEKYFILKEDPVPISVSQAEASTSIVSSNSEPDKVKPSKKKPSKQKKVYDLQLLSENWIGAIQPVFYKQNFLIAQGIPVLALIGLVWIRKRHLRMENDSSYARLVNSNRQLKQWSKELSKAQTSANVPAFFAAARHMIQEASSKYFNRSLKAESLTRDEIADMLQTKGKDSEIIEEMKVIFDQCDALHFAGGQTGTQELPQWRERIEKLINQI